MDTRLVIATYQPKAGQTAALSLLVDEHQRTLHRLGFIRGAPAACIVLDDDTSIEITDYADDDSRIRAAVNPDVLDVRQRVASVTEAVRHVDIA